MRLLKRLFINAFLEDKEFRTLAREAMQVAESEYGKHPNSAQDALIELQKEKLAKQGSILRQCLADYRVLHSMHASEYADRRFKELNDAIEELDKA